MSQGEAVSTSPLGSVLREELQRLQEHAACDQDGTVAKAKSPQEDHELRSRMSSLQAGIAVAEHNAQVPGGPQVSPVAPAQNTNEG